MSIFFENAFWPYVGPMLVICAVLALCGLVNHSERAVRFSSAVFGVWFVGTMYVQATGDWTPFWFFFALDFFAALIILARPSGKIGAALGACFVGQLMTHLGFAVVWLDGDPVYSERLAYIQQLDALAWLQLVVLATWGTYGGGTKIIRYFGYGARDRVRHVPGI